MVQTENKDMPPAQQDAPPAQQDTPPAQQDTPVAVSGADTGEPNEGESDGLSRPRRVHVPIEEKATIATEVTRRALDLMGVEVESVAAVVDGEQVGLTIGAITKGNSEALDGRAWESLQFLLNKAVNRHAIKRTRLNLEAEGFRPRRSEGLDAVVSSIARKVQQTGKAIAIGPMEGGDLRLLATQLSRVSGISVQTTGEQDKRLLVVSPGGGGRRRRR